MDFDREYNKPRRPGNEEDFTDQNVQALIEGRRSWLRQPLPRPNVQPISDEAAERFDRLRRERHQDTYGRGY